MAINLTKGQTISLNKDEHDLSTVTIGLGWQIAKKSGGLLNALFGGGAKDLDLDILLVEVSAHRVVTLAAPVHVSSFQKFIGIVVIVALSIWFAESKAVAAVLKPLLTAGRLPLIAYAAVSNRIFEAVSFPVKYLISVLKPKRAEPKPTSIQ